MKLDIEAQKHKMTISVPANLKPLPSTSYPKRHGKLCYASKKNKAVSQCSSLLAKKKTSCISLVYHGWESQRKGFMTIFISMWIWKC